jgi:hypothetical protein
MSSFPAGRFIKRLFEIWNFSNWGFFKHKWIIAAMAIIFGTFFLGPWETTMINISGALGIA